MTPEEWMQRYVKRYVDVGAFEATEAAGVIASFGTYEELSDGFEDDPEGAADEEMSYWDAE